MKFCNFFFLLLLFWNCGTDQPGHDVFQEQAQKVQSTDFQSIIDSSLLKGSILIYNSNEAKYYSNDFQWAEDGKLPASTFKIANSIIALETGVVESDSTWLRWDGEERSMEIWEQDLLFRNAFHYSCVPCYQEIARKIGVKRMNSYLVKLDFGKMMVDSSNIDMFWLRGESQITAMEQIGFLRRFYHGELPISERTHRIMKRMFVMEDKDGYSLSGKTGWSIQNNINNGWFVGFVETQNNVIYFAANIEPTGQFEMNQFGSVRREIVYKALSKLGLNIPS